MDKFQIVQHEIVDDFGTTSRILWSGDMAPTEHEIESARQQLIAVSLDSDQPRPAMCQEINDFIQVRRQRTPRFFGWTSIRSINLFEEAW